MFNIASNDTISVEVNAYIFCFKNYTKKIASLDQWPSSALDKLLYSLLSTSTVSAKQASRGKSSRRPRPVIRVLPLISHEFWHLARSRYFQACTEPADRVVRWRARSLARSRNFQACTEAADRFVLVMVRVKRSWRLLWSLTDRCSVSSAFKLCCVMWCCAELLVCSTVLFLFFFHQILFCFFTS
jgi:hypothetical protein